MEKTGKYVMNSYKAVKVLGERNVGTNFLNRVINRNFDVPLLAGTQPMKTEEIAAIVNTLPPKQRRIGWEMVLDTDMRRIDNENFGWKHACPDFANFERYSDAAAETLFVVVSKHPLAWAASFYRRPYHCLFNRNDMSFSDFIRHPWIATSKENIHPAIVPNVIDLWNIKHRGWLELDQRGYPVHFIRYNDLVTDFQGEMGKLGEKLAKKHPGKAYSNIERSTKADGRSLDEIRNEYFAIASGSKLLPDDLAFITANLDANIVRAYGYELQPQA